MTRVLYTSKRKKKARRRFSRPTRLFLALFFCVITFLIALFFVLRIPYLQIRRIEVLGIEILDAQKIKEHVSDSLKGTDWFFIPRGFIFAANTQKAGDELTHTFLKIRSVEIKKEFPDVLNVFIRERNLFGIFCNDLAASKEPLPKESNPSAESTSVSQCGYLDEDGFVYGEAPEARGSLLIKVKSDAPLFRIGAQSVDGATMARLVLVRQELSRVTGIRVTSFELSSQMVSEMRLETAEGFKIFIKKDDDFAKRFQVLKKVLDDEIKGNFGRLAYLDLRFGNKVFYKMK